MAENHDTQTRAPEKPPTPEKSKPEKLAFWLFKTSSSLRPLLGFALIGAIGFISLRFNYELGKLSAVDDVSKQLLPFGYALLDICALFLSGLIGLKSRSQWRKACAWGWFLFLVCLSLWAAASFTLSIDSRLANTDLTHAIEQKKTVVDSLNKDVETWQKNVAEAVNFKSKHQNTLSQVQARQQTASDELHSLESQLVAPAMAIYDKTAPLVGVSSETLNLFVRLLWAAALTLSPLVLGLLGWAEWEDKNDDNTPPNKKAALPSTLRKNRGTWQESAQKWNRERKARKFLKKHTRPAVSVAHELRETPSTLHTASGNVRTFPAAHGDNVRPIKGNNQHTETLNLNAFKYAVEWLAGQSFGRITRDKLAFASKLKSRTGVSLIIEKLINDGLLYRHANGQLFKTDTMEQGIASKN